MLSRSLRSSHFGKAPRNKGANTSTKCLIFCAGTGRYGWSSSKTDRLCRNLHDFVAVEDLVEELDIEIHLIKEGQILRKAARSQDRLVQGIFALLARNYIQNMQEEISKG